MKTKLLLVILVSSCLVPTIQAQDSVARQQATMLDVIPSNAQVGLAWPEVTKLGPQVNKLAQEVYPGSGQFILSTAKSFFSDAGIDYNDESFSKIIDRKRPGAMLGLMSNGIDTVSVMPAGDLEKLARMLKVDVDQLKSGEIVQSRSPRMNHVRLKRGQVYFSNRKETLETAGLDSPIGERLTEDQQKQFLSSDALLFLDKKMAGEFLGGFLGVFGDLSWLNIAGDHEPSSQLTELAKAAANEFSFGLAGIELDGGLGIRYTNFFDQNGDAQTQKLIETIRGGDGASNLDHLPNANFVAAFAARGTGDKNVLAAKAFLKAIVNRVSPGDEILTAKDKPVFYESFATIWQQLNGTRIGVYRIESEAGTDGELAAIAIFDVVEPKKLLAQLPELVKFANESAERNTAEEDLLPIRFNYLPAAQNINGYSADILEIDTDRLDDKTKKRFRVLFGEQAKQLRLVPVDNHLLMLIGTDTEILTKTIENLAGGNIGLTNHPAIVSANQRIDARRKIEAHFSFPNLLEIYTFKEQPKPYQIVDEISSLAITIESERSGIDSWFPAKDISSAIDWSLLW